MIGELYNKAEQSLDRIDHEFPVFYDQGGTKEALRDLESLVLQEANPSGVRMTTYESSGELESVEKEFGSLEARTASAYGINLARQLGTPPNDTFNEGFRIIESRRKIQDHFGYFTDSEEVMPVFVPSDVKEFMDLRLDLNGRESDNPYPATLCYQNRELNQKMPVFVHSFDELMDKLKSREYVGFHQDLEDWKDHVEYDEMVEVIEKSRKRENPSIFAIPHIFDTKGEGTYFPPKEEIVLINTVNNYFADSYDPSNLHTTGNSPAKNSL